MEKRINELLNENGYPNILFKEASYNKNSDILSVILKYACNLKIEESDKERITRIIKKSLDMEDLNLVIELKPIYIDDEEISKFNSTFFQENFNYTIIIDNSKTIIDSDSRNITFFIDEKYYDRQDKEIFKNSYQTKFKLEFCQNYNIAFKTFSHDQESVIDGRKSVYMSEEKFGNFYKIDVKVLENVINEVSETNEFTPICEIKDSDQEIYVCGIIDFITDKEFTKKYTNKDGNEITQTKKFYSLKIKDETGNISCVLFTAKENLEKVEQLKIGETIAISATTDAFGDAVNLKIKSLAKCTYTFEMNTIYKKLPNKYMFVKPEPYESFEQTMIFDFNSSIKNEYLLNNNFVVFDLETTGLEAGKDKIIEIGAVKIEKGIITEQFSTFVNPEMNIPADATKVNNITDEMVKDAPTIEKVLSDFMLFSKDCVLVAYNVDFDSKFIKNNCKKQFYEFSNKLDDCLVWARNKVLGLKNYKLKTVCEKMNVSLIGAHRAVNDTIATAKLFIKLVEM